MVSTTPKTHYYSFLQPSRRTRVIGIPESISHTLLVNPPSNFAITVARARELMLLDIRRGKQRGKVDASAESAVGKVSMSAHWSILWIPLSLVLRTWKTRWTGLSVLHQRRNQCLQALLERQRSQDFAVVVSRVRRWPPKVRVPVETSEDCATHFRYTTDSKKSWQSGKPMGGYTVDCTIF